jgi:hypothetical protein
VISSCYAGRLVGSRFQGSKQIWFSLVVAAFKVFVSCQMNELYIVVAFRLVTSMSG